MARMIHGPPDFKAFHQSLAKEMFAVKNRVRNQSGHPTGEDVSAEDAEAIPLLFPGFYEVVDKLIAELSKAKTIMEEDTDG